MKFFEIFSMFECLSSFSRQLFSSTTEDEKSNESDHSSAIVSDKEQGIENTHDNEYPNKNGDGNKFNIDKLMQNLNKKQRRIVVREYERQGNNCCL
jgi:hypothetical protein